MQWPFPTHVVDADELEQGRVDEAHADTVPHVHRRQIGHDRQSAPETIGRCEKIQHGRYTLFHGWDGNSGVGGNKNKELLII